MRARLSQLDMAVIAAVALYLVAIMPVSDVIASIAGVLSCFLVLGFVAASAILPKDAGWLAWSTAVTSVMLAVGVVGGVILNFLPTGLSRFNWLTYGLIATLVAYAVTRARGVRNPLGGLTIPQPSRAAAVKAAASVAAVGAAVGLTLFSTNVYEREFTELWIVPDNPARSPVRVVHAVIGVKSHESSPQAYTVVMKTGHKVISQRLTLRPDESWTQPVQVENLQANVSLYRGEPGDTPYRTVWFATP